MSVLDKIKGGLIVSCQALKSEPLYSSEIMARMAYAAEKGGAVGIRANTPEDIVAIKKEVNLPVIGLYKVDYDNSEIYITPTMKEIDAIMASSPEIVALDATNRKRPDGSTIETFFPEVRKKYPDMIFMADCASYEDGIRAQELGFDVVGTTLCGYTPDTRDMDIPCFEMIEKLAENLTIPLIAEGGIWETKQLQQVFECGAYAAVIGTAITRPREITKRFVAAITK
jgi:N-acylglucosamine-6-phosphate 2-epimerase